MVIGIVLIFVEDQRNALVITWWSVYYHAQWVGYSPWYHQLG